MKSPDGRFAELAGLLEALASSTRLEILHRLRDPTTMRDIRVAPQLSRGDERPERALTRQAVTHHLQQLRAQGLVQQVPGAEGRADSYVLDHARLFALVDEVRSLTKLRPMLPGPEQDASETVERPPAPPQLPAAPRLMVAYGREDAQGFHLGEGDAWRVGRAADCEVQLDYDPYASGHHALIRREGASFTLTDTGSRNGTWVNWARIPSGKEVPLVSGALITIGRSVLVLQA